MGRPKSRWQNEFQTEGVEDARHQPVGPILYDFFFSFLLKIFFNFFTFSTLWTFLIQNSELFLSFFHSYTYQIFTKHVGQQRALLQKLQSLGQSGLFQDVCVRGVEFMLHVFYSMLPEQMEETEREKMRALVEGTENELDRLQKNHDSAPQPTIGKHPLHTK